MNQMQQVEIGGVHFIQGIYFCLVAFFQKFPFQNCLIFGFYDR